MGAELDFTLKRIMFYKVLTRLETIRSSKQKTIIGIIHVNYFCLLLKVYNINLKFITAASE